MSMTPKLGQIVQSFFEDHLKAQKGLRPASICSYRDTMRLFLVFASKQAKKPITALSLETLTFETVLRFLDSLEIERQNHIRTRNQRRAALRVFYDYVALRVPEMLHICEQVAAIAVKRCPPSETHYLDQGEVKSLLKELPKTGRHAIRDRALILFLYNTGARAQEATDLRICNLDLGAQPRVQLHGKGDKWRTCPLWEETKKQLQLLLRDRQSAANDPVFCARPRVSLTRFGIYKIIRRHGSRFDTSGAHPRRVSPHLFRHTAAVHLLESGVEVNVIRGWLGHVGLETTNRYAELTLRAKEAALRTCEPKFDISAGCRQRAVWRDDESLLGWLDSL